jgi:hypothetical protein
MRFGEGHALGCELAQAGRFDFAQRIQRVHIAIAKIIRQNVDDIGAVVLLCGLDARSRLATGQDKEANEENICDGKERFPHKIVSGFMQA